MNTSDSDRSSEHSGDTRALADARTSDDDTRELEATTWMPPAGVGPWRPSSTEAPWSPAGESPASERQWPGAGPHRWAEAGGSSDPYGPGWAGAWGGWSEHRAETGGGQAEANGPGGPRGPGRWPDAAPGPGHHPAGPWIWSPHTSQQQYPGPRPRQHTGLWLGLVAALLFLATVSGIGIRHWANSSSSSLTLPTTAPPTSSGSAGGPTTTLPGNAVSAIAGKVTPALVDVDTVLGYQRAEAAGTGIVLTPNGLVLTNNHVLEGATQIRVTDLAYQNVYSASVVGYDRNDDIAVIQLKGASGLKTAAIGDSSKVAIGQAVVGVGNAGGTGGAPTPASGRVTALNQSVTASDEADGTTENLTGLIQTNANIQAGDSGGPLVNSAGQVIGVNTAGSTGFSFRNPGHEGFAIPINKAQSISKQIQAKKSGATVHIGATAFLGVQVSTTGGGAGNSGGGNSGSSGSGVGNSGSPSSGGGSGAPVAGVLPGTPAAGVGLAQGDTITALAGHHVGSPTDLSTVLDAYHPGDAVPLTWVDSSGQSHSATVTLTSGPAA